MVSYSTIRTEYWPDFIVMYGILPAEKHWQFTDDKFTDDSSGMKKT